MNVRHTRTLIHVASAVLAAGAVGAAVWGLRPLPTAPEATSRRTAQQSAGSIETSEASASLADSAVWNRKLRGPLQDPPKPKPKPTVVRKPKPPRVAPPPPRVNLDITLVGTILESGRDVGVFADAAGKYDRKSAGQTLDLEPAGVMVERVEADNATVSLRGQTSTLKINTNASKKKPGKKTGRGNRQR